MYRSHKLWITKYLFGVYIHELYISVPSLLLCIWFTIRYMNHEKCIWVMSYESQTMYMGPNYEYGSQRYSSDLGVYLCMSPPPPIILSRITIFLVLSYMDEACHICMRDTTYSIMHLYSIIALPWSFESCHKYKPSMHNSRHTWVSHVRYKCVMAHIDINVSWHT